MMSIEGSARRMLRRLHRCRLYCRDEDPASTVDAPVDNMPPEIVAGNYAVLAETIGNIFNEFWQGNAFFLAFATVVLGSILTHWTSFVEAPPIAILAIGVSYIFLLGIWLLTMARHVFYIKLHMDHAMQLEGKTSGLEVYTHRVQEATKSRLPSTRKIWLTVPVLFALCMVAVEVSALTGVAQGQSPSSHRGVQAPLSKPSKGSASSPGGATRTVPSVGSRKPGMTGSSPETATSR